MTPDVAAPREHTRPPLRDGVSIVTALHAASER